MYQAVISLKEVIKTRHARGSWRHYSPLALCTLSFNGRLLEEELPRPFTQSLLSPLTKHRDYSGRILAAPTTGLSIHLICLYSH